MGVEPSTDNHNKYLRHIVIAKTVIFEKTWVKTCVRRVFTELFMHFTITLQNYFCLLSGYVDESNRRRKWGIVN